MTFRRPASTSGRAVIEDLIRDHGEALRRFVALRMRSTPEIDDLLQDVYLRLARVDDLADKVSRGSGSTRAYLYSIANNLIVDRLRQNAMRARYGLTDPPELPDLVSNETPERIVAGRQDLDRVMKLLAELNPKWRTAFVLNRFKFMGHRQIAEEMGVRPKRVEKYIASALAALRKDREEQG